MDRLELEIAANTRRSGELLVMASACSINGNIAAARQRATRRADNIVAAVNVNAAPTLNIEDRQIESVKKYAPVHNSNALPPKIAANNDKRRACNAACRNLGSPPRSSASESKSMRVTAIISSTYLALVTPAQAGVHPKISKNEDGYRFPSV
jgi:hypothetical protein